MISDIISVVSSVVKTGAKLLGGDRAKAASDLMGDIAKLSQTDPEMQKALQDHDLELRKLIAKDAEGARALIREESKSEDPFVRRARPMFLYIFYALIAINFALIPFLNMLLTVFNKAPVFIAYPSLPSELYWLFGSAFLGYSGLRTIDKRGKISTLKGFFNGNAK